MGKNEEPMNTGSPDPLDGVEWETLNTGSLGTEHDFDRDGDLIGHFLGSRTVETDKVESGEATAYQFAPVNAPDEIVFVWGSAEIAAAFADVDNQGPLVRAGDLVKIHSLGRHQFTGQDGKPRQVKRFKIQAAKRS